MKHLLNNLSSEEKNNILERYNKSVEVSVKKFKTLVETSLGEVKPLINEDNTTGDTVYNDYISKGYKDITTYYFSPEGVVLIPDGDYVGKGSGYSEEVMSKDGKNTGYVFFYTGGVRSPDDTRGLRTSTVRVTQNGGAIGSSGGKITKILLNESILNSSGLKKQ